MKLSVSVIALSTALLFSPMTNAIEQTSNESFLPNLNGFDVNWLKGTAEADLFEIELGILAQKKMYKYLWSNVGRSTCKRSQCAFRNT